MYHVWSRNCPFFRNTWVHTRWLVGFQLLTLQFSVKCFVDRCFSLYSFSFGHCIFCPSSIYRFWLPFGVSKLFLPLSYSQCIIAIGRKNRPRCIGQNCRWMNRFIPTSIPRKHTTGEFFYHGFKFSKKCICYAQTIYCSYKLSKMCSIFIDY